MYRHSNNAENNAEYLSPWQSEKSWSFNPQQFAVVTRQSSQSAHLQPTRKSPRKAISAIQLCTLSLLVISIALLAAITALLLG